MLARLFIGVTLVASGWLMKTAVTPYERDTVYVYITDGTAACDTDMDCEELDQTLRTVE